MSTCSVHLEQDLPSPVTIFFQTLIPVKLISLMCVNCFSGAVVFLPPGDTKALNLSFDDIDNKVNKLTKLGRCDSYKIEWLNNRTEILLVLLPTD